MAATLGWGIALVVLGLILTFTHLFGFIVGLPLLGLGFVLLAIGVVLGGVHFMNGRRGDNGRIRGRTI